MDAKSLARMPRHIVCLTFDFDTQSGFIARGMTTPTPLSRGEFGAMASGRILKFLKERGIKATWFTPGFTIESWPKESAAVAEGGHEIGHHSWAHIPNANQSRDEEEADLVRANENISKLTGRTARGYRSPSWDLSAHTIDLLIKHGFLYDSSLMGADYIPYRARRGDKAELGKPYGFGEETSLIEMPISWSLDDHPHFEFIRTPQTVTPGLRPARDGHAKLARRVSLYEEDRRLGRADLHHASLCDRPRLPHAGAGGFDRRSSPPDGAVFMTMEQAAEEAKARLFAGGILRRSPQSVSRAIFGCATGYFCVSSPPAPGSAARSSAAPARMP